MLQGPLSWYEHATFKSKNVTVQTVTRDAGCIYFEAERSCGSSHDDTSSSFLPPDASITKGLLTSVLLSHEDLSHPVPILKSSNVLDSIASSSSLSSFPYQTPGSEDIQSLSSSAIILTTSAPVNGVIQGTISLPKMANWVISLTISNDSQDNSNGLLSTDSVVIRLGATPLTLTLIGTFFNRMNPDTGAIYYQVKYLLRGHTLAYSFEFSSRSRDRSKQLAVQDGVYSEYQIEPLEVMTIPGTNKIKVLSSFVKTIRVEESQGTVTRNSIVFV